jgi:16S rRNA processing protein RimM
MKYIIGKVLRPRGLKGELRVQILTNLTDVFSNLKKIYIDKQPYEVTVSSIQNKFAYIKLKGINTIEDAENFRDLQITVTKATLKLESDDILSEDLVGFTIVNQKDKTLGIVNSIEFFGERVLVNTESFSFPYEDDFVVETNVTDRKVVVREGMLHTEEVR